MKLAIVILVASSIALAQTGTVSQSTRSNVVDLGGLGIACFLMWKLFDKWAGLFLNSQGEQTKAMSAQATATASLANAVRDGQADQREILMAVRLLADRIDGQKGFLMAIDENCRKRGCIDQRNG